MTTTARGRHRKLRRNILHTVIATALLAGTFTAVDQAINSKISPANATTPGGNDTAFNTAIAGNAPTASVVDTTLDSSGNVYVAHGNVVRKYSPTGAWLWTSPATVSGIADIAVHNDGRVVVATGAGMQVLNSTGTSWGAQIGGTSRYFNKVRVIGDQILFAGDGLQASSPFLGRMTMTGASVTQILSGTFNGLVWDMDVDSAGNIFVVGDFTSKAVKLTSSYTLDTSFAPGITSNASLVAVSSTGLVAIGGLNSGGVNRVSVFSPTGGSTTFGSNLGANFPNWSTTSVSISKNADLAFDSSGRLLVGSADKLIRILPTGVKDSDFKTDISSTVRSVTVQPDQKIIVGLSASPWLKRLSSVFETPGVPPAPTATVSDRSANVAVTAGAGVAPTSYTVTASPGGATCTVTGASGSCNVLGLINGTDYTFTAIALNGDAPSTSSSASNSVTPMRIIPTFVSATNTSAGNTIVLTYDVDLLESPLPIASMFTVQENGVNRTVSGVAVSGKTVTLSLSPAAQKGATVTVAYQAPLPDDSTAVAAIQGLSGTDALSLATTTLSTNSSTFDTTPPTLISGEILSDGFDVRLVFNEQLRTNNPPATSKMDFTVFNPADGTTNTITVASIVSISGNTVTIRRTGTVPNGFQSSRVVSFNYRQGTLNDTSTINANFQDEAGNDLREITRFSLVNSSTLDTEAPIIFTASPNQPFVSADGNTLTLTYNEPLHPTTAIPDNFTVKVGAETRSISAVSTSGSTVILTLASPIGQGITTSNPQVTVAYLAPTAATGTDNAAVQDLKGNDATSFSAINVVNNSTIDKTVPILVTDTPDQPVLDSTGTKITLTFNEALAATTASKDDFVVLVDGQPVGVNGVNATGSTIELTLDSPVEANTVVTVAYNASTSDPGTGNNAIQDIAGNDADTFGTTAVINNSSIDTNAPVLITSGASAPTLSANGTTLTLTYNEAVNSTLPDLSDFVVYVNGSPVTVSSVVRGTVTSTIVITLASPVGMQPGFDVTADLPSVLDTANNAGSSSTNVVVTNNSTQDLNPPVLTSASVSTLGTSLVLFYDESLNVVNKPAASAFVVTASGNPVSVNSVTVNGSTVSLALGSTINAGLVVTVAYTAPEPDRDATNAAIQDTAGNDAASIFNTFGVTNNSIQGPITVIGGTVNSLGNAITLTLNKAYNSVGYPVASGFRFLSNTTEVNCLDFTYTGTNQVVLTNCSPIISSGAVVTANWTPGSGTTAPMLRDSFSVMAAFSDRLITNNSTVDLTPPVSTALTNTADGMTLTLAFSEDLLSTLSKLPSVDQFTITTDGYPTSVSNVSVSGSNLVLTLASPVGANSVTSVTYTAPSTLDQTTNNSAIQDVAGNDTLTFTRELSSNSSTVYQGPRLVSSAVNTDGNSIVLTFDVPLNATTAAASAFVVTSNGEAVNVSNATVSGSTITLSISPAAEANDIIQVGYTAPNRVQDDSNNAIQDISGIDAASISLRTVTDNNSTRDTQGPVVTTPAATISADGLTMSLTFNEDIVAVGTPVSAFTVLVDGIPVVPTGVSFANETASFTFSPAIGAGREVTVAYTAPGDNTAIKDVAGNFAASFGAQAVTNNSTIDDIRPTLSLIARPILAADGTTLTLTYSEDLAASFPAVTDDPFPFTILSDGVSVEVTAISRPTPTTIQMTLGSVIKIGKTVTVEYSAPIDDPGTNNSAVQDAAGNDSLSFQPQAVTNQSNQGTGITSVVIGANGTSVTLYYNKSTTPPAFSSLQWLVDGDPVTLTSTGTGSNNGIITYNFTPTIFKDSVVTLSYTAPNDDLQTVSSVSDFPVTNNSTIVPERIAPVLSSAVINSLGTTLTLNYNEALNTKTALPADFAISINGEIFNPAAVNVSGSSVVLSVGRTITSTDVVTLTYNAPTPSTTKNFAIQDIVGNDAAAFTDQPVTNGSTSGPDVTGPTASSISVSGAQVTISMNEFLNSTTAGTDRYTVFVGNDAVTPTGISISGQNVILTLPSPVPAGTVVAVSYTAPSPAIADATNLALQDYIGNDAISFNLSTQDQSSNWEWVGATPTQTCPGAGSAYPNTAKSKLLPNGVTYTVAVTGDFLCIDRATESLSQRGGKAGDFQSVGLVTEPGLKMWTSNNGCVANQLNDRCDNRGVMTISFSKPVTNPVISFAGWGGGSNGASWTEMKLLTAGATFRALAGTNIDVSENGTYVGNVPGTIPSIGCHRTTGYGANAQAVCGSLQVDGVHTSLSFQINMEYAAVNLGSDGGNEDAWNLTASIPEDFGMVPASYDNPVASHAIGSLKLGSVVTADNPSSLYSTTNADSVAPGVEIKPGAKNISNADVVIDDGVLQSSWIGLVDNRAGQIFTIPVTLEGVAETANLCAWIDFNRDGVFTATERACAVSPTIGQTSANISWTIPNDIVSGPTYARVRLSYDPLPLPTGKVGSGEVEDYSVLIASSAIPSANRDDSIGTIDVNQTINPLSNDQFEPDAANDMTKMFLCLPTQSPMNCTIGAGQSLTIPGEGTYTLNSDGTVTFDPEPTFTGTATPIGYQIADTDGRTSSSTINPVVIPAPVGVPDTSSGAYDKDQIINPLSNDIPGSPNYPLLSNSIKLCQVDDPLTTDINEAQSPNNCSATSVTIPDEGTYTVNSDGTVTFNPLPTFYGTVATPVRYQAQDTLGQFENSTITPTVDEPPAADATDDFSTGNYDTNQLIKPLENDSFDDNEQNLLPETLVLCDPTTTPPQTSPNCTLKVLNTADGTYTVNSDGTVTFDPLPTFTGTVAVPVVYQVTDALGRKVSANITPTVGLPPAPSASPETTTGPFNTPQRTSPLENETPGSASFPLSATDFKLCADGETPNTCSATSVTIPGEGTYTYDATTRKITFTPLDTFVGEATPVVYQTKDSLNRFVNSTYSPEVLPPPPPAADDETSTGAFNTPQAPIDVLLGDTPGDPAAPLVPSTLRLCDTTTNPIQTGETCNATKVTTPDGIYEIVDGKVVFTPAQDFHGEANPIDYIVKDTLGQIAQGTITPTVEKPAPPTASPETKSVLPGQSVSFTTITGENGLADGTGLQTTGANATCLVADANTTPSTGCVTSLSVAGEGTYTLDPATGIVTFAADANATPGTKTPITYQVTDITGQTKTSTLTPIIPQPPTANPDTTTGAKGLPQEVSLIANDSAATGATLDPTSVKLCDPNPTAEVAPDCTKTSVTVPGVGTYAVDSTGKMTFTPDPDFVGTPTPLSYTVTDSLGAKASSTYTPTVIGTPTATPDTSSGPQGVAQSINVVTNDSAASGTTLVSSTVTLSCASAPNCTRDIDGSVTIDGQGTYTARAADGTVIFTPLPAFTGTATPVTYTVSDALGQSATTTYTPTVIPAPVAIDDTSINGQDKNQLIDVLDNDTVPTNPAGDPLDPTTVKLCGTAEVAPNCTLTELTTPEGTYSVNPTTGVVTFDPIPSFTGTVSTPVRYQVSDTGVTPQTTSALITPTVIPGPTALNDTSSGPMNTAQTETLVTNDSAATGATLDIASVKLCDPNAPAEVAPDCTKTSVTVPGVGTYAVDSSGVMTFTPVNGYSGTPAPLAYTVEDNFDVKATATYTPTVIPPPTVVPDTSTGPWNTDQTRNVIDNNVDTSDSAAPGTTLAAGSVRLCAPTDTAPDCTIDASGSVVIPNQGTYTVDPATGIVTFDPLPTFVGTATPVTYSVTDALGQKSSTTYTPTVAPPPAPMADPETTSGPKGATQTIDLLPGDTTFDPLITLDPTSVKLCGISPAEVMPNCTQSSLTVAGVGTYAVSNGVMTFTPEPNYTGTPAPVSYQVTDSLGGKATSTYTPTVIAPPTVVPDTSTGPWDTDQTRNVIDNNVDTSDSAAPGTTLAAGSVRLCAPTDTAPDCTIDASGSVVIPNQGTYTVDPATGIVTFDPLPTFTGTATPVTYSVTDALGQKSSTTYTPTVTVPPVPTATPDTVELIPGQSKVFSSIFDGPTGDSDPALATKGTGGPDLINSTVCLIDPATSVCDTDGIVTIPGEGTYTLDPTTGIVTYAALSSATPGAKTPVTYQITDGLNRSVTSTLSPTITPQPVANPDFSTGVQGAIQTISPVGNDRPGGGASTELYPDKRVQIPSGVFLCAANQPPPDCAASTVTVNDPVTGATLGVLTVADSGLVTFTPEPDFIGTTPPIGYQIPDNLGQKAYSTITITVVPPPAPSATIDTGSAEYNMPVTLKPWINDAPGTRPDNSMRSDGTPYPAPNLVATSIKLCDDNSTFVAMSGTPADCTAMKVKTVEGTYEVNATTGEVVFTPVNGFTGTVKYPPTYQIWNDWTGLGGAKSATALLVPTIAPPGAPAASVDVTKTKPGTSVVLNPVANDKPGSYALDPTTIRLCGDGEIAPACTQMSVMTLDGLYVVDPTSGQVTFTPRDGFTGEATIPYVIHDAGGMMANSHLIITVEDTAIVPAVQKTKVGLAKTGGTRPDLLLLLGLVAIAGAGGLRLASRKN